MTIAQMSLVICEMIDRGMVHSVTSTGALMAHGLVPGLGLKHYKYNPKDNDEKLAKLGLNRVTDVLEPETNFDHIDEIMSAVLNTFSGRESISPSVLHRALGKYLEDNYPDHRAVLLSAYRKKVPGLRAKPSPTPNSATTSTAPTKSASSPAKNASSWIWKRTPPNSSTS